MSSSAIQPIRFDFRNACRDDQGFSPEKLLEMQPRLDAARLEVVATDAGALTAGDGANPGVEPPRDAAFYRLPDQCLAEYYADRRGSQLGRIMRTAKRLRDLVDRVVVLGSSDFSWGAKALMDACCQPYFNELSRGERACYPRMVFAGNHFDNDATQGLLALLGSGRIARSLEDRWALVVISKTGETPETAVALRQLLTALAASCQGPPRVAELVVPVTGARGRLFDFATALGCADIYPIADGAEDGFAILSAVGLLPAAILGINVVKLLEGAVAMNEHFRTAPVGQNAVLDYVAIRQCWREWGAEPQGLTVWCTALEAAGLWYDQLRVASLGHGNRDAMPGMLVNSRSMHSRRQPHQEGRRERLVANLIVDQPRCDPLPIGTSGYGQDGLTRRAGTTLPEFLSASIAETNVANCEAGRPSANIHLPSSDEASLGQFFQMMMLATMMEHRMIGNDPAGQPGIEANLEDCAMNRIL